MVAASSASAQHRERSLKARSLRSPAKHGATHSSAAGAASVRRLTYRIDRISSDSPGSPRAPSPSRTLARTNFARYALARRPLARLPLRLAVANWARSHGATAPRATSPRSPLARPLARPEGRFPTFRARLGCQRTGVRPIDRAHSRSAQDGAQEGQGRGPAHPHRPLDEGGDPPLRCARHAIGLRRSPRATRAPTHPRMRAHASQWTRPRIRMRTTASCPSRGLKGGDARFPLSHAPSSPEDRGGGGRRLPAVPGGEWRVETRFVLRKGENRRGWRGSSRARGKISCLPCLTPSARSGAASAPRGRASRPSFRASRPPTPRSTSRRDFILRSTLLDLSAHAASLQRLSKEKKGYAFQGASHVLTDHEQTMNAEQSARNGASRPLASHNIPAFVPFSRPPARALQRRSGRRRPPPASARRMRRPWAAPPAAAGSVRIPPSVQQRITRARISLRSL